MFKVDVLQSLVLRAGQNSKTAGVRWLLQQESCSWRLIASLYRYVFFRRIVCLCPAVHCVSDSSPVCHCRDRVQSALEDDLMADMVVSELLRTSHNLQ